MSEDKLSRKSSVKKNKSETESGKKLKERVQEFQLWHDDNTFTQLEYERRRSQKQRQKGILRSDRKLRIAKICYVPALLVILSGGCLLLLSTIDGLAVDTLVWNNKIYFQITGAVLLTIGVILLMTVAVYTYKREDDVRAKNGYPSLYEAARTRQASLKNIEETINFTCDFVDRRQSKTSLTSRLSRMTSVESKASFSNMGWSFSSNSTAMSWLQKHRHEHSKSASKVLRRDNSDSALDSYFARKRILSWQEQSSLVRMDSSEKAEESENAEGLDQNDVKSPDGVSESQALSSSSTTSSGYHSNISSPSQQKENLAFSYSRPFSESLSEQCDIQTQTSTAFTLSDEVVFEPPPMSVPLIPSIRIEYYVNS